MGCGSIFTSCIYLQPWYQLVFFLLLLNNMSIKAKPKNHDNTKKDKKI